MKSGSSLGQCDAGDRYSIYWRCLTLI